MNPIYVTIYAAIASVCWVSVMFGAAVAVFSPTINDTVSERVALSAVSLGSASAAYRIMDSGEVTDGGFFLALAMAFYVFTLFWKHWQEGRDCAYARKKS